MKIDMSQNLLRLASFLAVATTLSIVSSCETAPQSGAAKSVALSPLLNDGDCKRIEVRAPDARELDAVALRRLGDACLARAERPAANASIISISASAHNAAQAYAELGRRAFSGRDYADADRAADLSRRTLGDDSAALTGAGNDRLLYNRLKYNRLGIQIASKLERGLSGDPTSASSCLGEEACLRDGLGLFNENQFGVLALYGQTDDPDARTDFSRLQLLRARSEAKLAEKDTYVGGVDRALEALDSVIAQPQPSSVIAADARSAYIDIASSHADRILAGGRSENSILQAISYLERADRATGSPSTATQKRSALLLRLGETYVTLAKMRPLSTNPQTVAGDLCHSIDAYSQVLNLSGNDIALIAKANAGVGTGYAELANGPKLGCRGQSGADAPNRAVAAFETAWSFGSGQYVSPENAMTYSNLLLEQGRKDEAKKVRDSKPYVSGKTAMDEDLLRLAKNLAKNPGSLDEAERYFKSAIAANESSPTPKLEYAKYLFNKGDAAQANRIDDLLAKAIASAPQAPSPSNSAAEAYYYRSLNEERRSGKGSSNSVLWAERAIQGDSTNHCFEYQACRAHLQARRPQFGAGEAYCSANQRTAEGAVFHALGLMRQAQIRRIARPNASLSAFDDARDAFLAASNAISKMDNATTQAASSMACAATSPDSSFSTLDKMARYGASMARACGTPKNEPVAPPSAELQEEISGIFEGYGFSSCNSIK